jgi:hypothetical protein
MLPKAIFRRSNSLSDNLKASFTQEESAGKKHPVSKATNKATLQHSHSIASFNFDAPSSRDDSPALNDLPPPVHQAPSPARMFRQELDSYVRDAAQHLNVAIFQAECWTIAENNESLYFTVPFFIRAELGVSAYARQFAEANDLPASLTHSDIIAHKLFKYVPVPLSIKCTPVNLNGIARSVQTVEPRPYVSIAVSNLGPLDTAQENNANPTRPWLELLSIEAESKKKKREESHTYYVNIVDMETEGKKLVDVMFDGEYYGNVYRLRITTCTAPPINRTAAPTSSLPSLSSAPPSGLLALGSSPASTSVTSLLTSFPTANEEEQIVFPVMTYLPLNLPWSSTLDLPVLLSIYYNAAVFGCIACILTINEQKKRERSEC